MCVTLKRIASCLIVVCLTAAILAGLTNITENKASLHKYMQFFRQEPDFDVLFIGSSKVINGVLPMELWNDYGIVSYNMGGHANTIPTSYWVLRNALEYTSPKCVVFDCHGASGNGRISNQFDYAHLSFDSFPLTSTKIQAVLDLVNPSDWEDVQARRMELLWNFSIYHSRWSTVGPGDFQPAYSYQKGAELRPNVSLPSETAVVSPDARSSWDALGTQYLIRAIDLCKERGIDIILINLPYPASEGSLIAANTVADVAQTYGVDYINFLTMDIVNYQTDMYDPDSHLNPSGAYKITDYLGKVLSRQYGIADQRNHPDYQSWHKDAEKYQQEKIKLFADATSAWNYWMLLSDDDFSFVAELSAADLQQDKTLAALLRNAGIQPENVIEKTIIAANRTSGIITYTEHKTLLQGPVETALGTLSLEKGCLKLDEQICWQFDNPNQTPAAVRFALFDAEKNLADTSQFSIDKIQATIPD